MSSTEEELQEWSMSGPTPPDKSTIESMQTHLGHRIVEMLHIYVPLWGLWSPRRADYSRRLNRAAWSFLISYLDEEDSVARVPSEHPRNRARLASERRAQLPFTRNYGNGAWKNQSRNLYCSLSLPTRNRHKNYCHLHVMIYRYYIWESPLLGSIYVAYKDNKKRTGEDMLCVHVCCVSLLRPPACAVSIIGHDYRSWCVAANEHLFIYPGSSACRPFLAEPLGPTWPAGFRRCACAPPGGCVPQLLLWRAMTRAGCSQLTR